MSESYVELLVKKKANPIMKLAKYTCILFTVACVLLAFMGLLPLLLGAVIFGVVSYFVTLHESVEYEYLYVNKELSIDKIMAQTKRKKVAEFDLQRMEILAPANSYHLDSYKNNQKCVAKNYASGADGSKPYVFIYNGDNELLSVTIDMNDTLLKCIRDIAPRKVFMD